MLFQWYTFLIFCMIGDETLGKICYCFPLMSIHGISKISEFFQILIADNSLTMSVFIGTLIQQCSLTSGVWLRLLGLVLCLFCHSRVSRFWYPLTSFSHPCWQRKCIVKKNNRVTKRLVVVGKSVSHNAKPNYIHNIYEFMCVYINICTYFIWLYISDFWVDIFLCTHNMHSTKCVYTPLSLNPYTSTLCRYHSGRWWFPHFYRWRSSESAPSASLEQGWTQIFKALRQV